MKKVIFTTLVTLILGFVSLPSSAFTTVGNRSCGKWVEGRSNPGSYRNIGVISWLGGYISGMASMSGVDILKDRDADSVFLWVDNYCRSNPLENLSDAGNALYSELQKGLKK